MSDFLVRARRVVTMNAARDVVADGAVVVKDGGIADVGDHRSVRERHPNVPAHPRECAILAPGFVNAHQHLTGDRLMRSRIPDGITSDEAIFEWAVPVHGAHTPDDDRVSTTLALAEALSNGITTTVEAGTVAHPEAVLAAQTAIGTRGTLGSWGWDVEDGPWAGTVDEVLDRQRRVLELAPAGGLVTGWVTLVGHDLMSDDLVAAASDLARENGTHMTFHISPHTGDARSYLARTGARPLVHLDRLGVLGSHVLLAHGVHLDDDEVEVMTRTDTAVACCPWAYLRLAQGITVGGRFHDLRGAGVRIALGCDSENSGDMVDVLRAAALYVGLLRDRSMDPASITAADGLAAATIDGARAIGMDHLVGSIEIGKRADLVGFDGSGPEWTPPNDDPALQLIWGTDGRSVRDVWVDGRLVVDDRRVTTVDVPAVAEEALGRAERLGLTIRPL